MEENKSSGLAIASMVLGIVALCLSCCFYYVSIPCAVVGLILAAVSLKGNIAIGLGASMISELQSAFK